jgi:MFS family permease
MENPAMESKQKSILSSESNEHGSSPSQHATQPFHLWRNHRFTIFWCGQTLSNLGDSLAVIALPLLVLQATGSVTQMGIVAGCYGVGQLLSGIFAGVLVDRLNRRQFMMVCDLGRMLLYSLLPLYWWFIGPQIWLIYIVTFLGSCLGMGFQVAYITAVPNLVGPDQITEANGLLQASFALTYVIGPGLAGFISGRFSPALAIGFDALSFLISAITLLFIRFARPAPVVDDASNGIASRSNTDRRGWIATGVQDLLEGLHFLIHQPILRAVTILFALFSIIPAAGIELFIFHLQHDLKQSDTIVGMVFSLANIGAILGGLLAPLVRRHLGFGHAWLGGVALEGLFIAAIGSTSLLPLLILFTIGFTFADTSMRIFSMSLRQQITPDHLLGRVTAAFWTLNTAPGPIGALFTTILAAHIGASPTLLFMGVYTLFLAITGLFTTANVRLPERSSAYSFDKE